MTTTPDPVSAPPSSTSPGKAVEALQYRFALAAAELAANTRCEDVVLLDLRGRSPVTEYFLIATGTSQRQLRTVGDELRDLGKKMGYTVYTVSGYDSANWILVDFVHVVCHLFDGPARDFYDLELLWGDSPRIDWRAALGLPPESQRLPADLPLAAERTFRDADDEDAADSDEEPSVMVEFPNEDADSVERVEVDSPNKRRNRGKSVFPTPLHEVADLGDEQPGMSSTADQSLDEDDQEFRDEAEADRDPEAVAKEDLPQSRIVSRALGGVSASLSGSSIEDEDDESAAGDEPNQPREEAPNDKPAAEPTPRKATAKVLTPAAPKARSPKAGVVKPKPATKAKAKAKPKFSDAATRRSVSAKPLNPRKTKTKTKAKTKPKTKAAPRQAASIYKSKKKPVTKVSLTRKPMMSKAKAAPKAKAKAAPKAKAKAAPKAKAKPATKAKAKPAAKKKK